MPARGVAIPAEPAYQQKYLQNGFNKVFYGKVPDSAIDGSEAKLPIASSMT